MIGDDCENEENCEDSIFSLTRSYAALRAADLDWIVGLGYSWGGYILGCSQRLPSCLQHSARIGAWSQPTSGQEKAKFSPHLPSQ